MYKLLILFCFTLCNISFADLAENGLTSSRLNPTAYTGQQSSTLSNGNRMHAQISYVLAAIAAVGTLFIFYKAKSVLALDPAKGRKLFFIGLATFLLAIILLALPSFFFLIPELNGNIDMRAT